ncbi:MAG TPA: PH domain-containing protein [Beijerinckiaceae bacterium]|nr:PH domain-containing protein [Beijerinckiaceae bacterium]
MTESGAATPPSHTEPLVVRPSTKLLMPVYALAGFLIVLIYIHNSEQSEPQHAWLIIPLMLLLWTAAKHIRLKFTTLSIQAGKLRYETGMLGRSCRTMEVAKVQDVRVDRSVGQRLLGTGNLTIETAGEASRLTMTDIDRPQDVADRILDAARQMPQYRAR